MESFLVTVSLNPHCPPVPVPGPNIEPKDGPVLTWGSWGGALWPPYSPGVAPTLPAWARPAPIWDPGVGVRLVRWFQPLLMASGLTVAPKPTPVDTSPGTTGTVACTLKPACLFGAGACQ